MAGPTRTFTIEQRPDGRFVSRNEHPGDSPLGVDASLTMAIGSCRREATLASRQGCTVIIKARQPGGKWKEVARFEPPPAAE
jgi:hypothetical protein